jgi:ParB-like chromosome segregation protein Spo0J
MIKLISILKELKVIIYPNQQGVDIDDPDDELEELDIETLPIKGLVPNEPASKMDLPTSKVILKRMIKSMKKGESLPPILVRKLGRKYQILDGHHRYFAAVALGIDKIQARIIPPDYVEMSEKDYEDDY